MCTFKHKRFRIIWVTRESYHNCLQHAVEACYCIAKRTTGMSKTMIISKMLHRTNSDGHYLGLGQKHQQSAIHVTWAYAISITCPCCTTECIACIKSFSHGMKMDLLSCRNTSHFPNHLIHQILQVLNPSLYQDILYSRIVWNYSTSSDIVRFLSSFARFISLSDQTLWGDPSIFH